MAFIELVPEERAGDAADLFEADAALRGYLPNYTRAFAHRPDVYRAWRGLIGAIAGKHGHPALRARDPRRRAAAPVELLRARSRQGARGRVPERGRGRGPRAGTAGREPGRRRPGGARPRRRGSARRDRGHARGRRPSSALGLSDAEILDVVLAAAVRCFYSKTLDALGVEPDAAYHDLPAPLREALTVGRPIAGR